MKNAPMPPRRADFLWAAGYHSIGLRRRLTRDTGPSRAMRALVLARDGMACTCCGTAIAGRPHSVRWRNPDAGDSPANLLTFLGDGSRPRDPADHCARVDSGRDPMDAARGFRVPSGQDPALVPVMVMSRAGGMTLWLTAEGAYRTEPPPGAV